MIISKKALVNKIYKRIGGTVIQSEILEIVNIICQYIIDNIKDDISVSIKNFGTFSLFVFHSHKGINVFTKKEQHVKSFKTVKFYPHQIFIRLTNEQKNKFKNT